MPVLIDTNILLRMSQPSDPRCAIAERALNVLRGRHQFLCVTAQNVVEFWAVCTRPAGENGLGLTADQGGARGEGY